MCELKAGEEEKGKTQQRTTLKGEWNYRLDGCKVSDGNVYSLTEKSEHRTWKADEKVFATQPY